MKLPNITLTKKQITLIAIFLITIIIAITLTVLKNQNQEEPPIIPTEQKPKIEQADFQGIKPGETKIGKVEEELGEPISSVINSQGTIYQFQSGNQYLPYEVIVDGQDTVQFINRPLVEVPQENQIQTLTQQLKESPVVLYGQSSLSGVNLYVFIKSGLAVEATQKSGLGLTKKYFPPEDNISTIIEKHFPDYSLQFDPERYHD